jgi:hypothetical protein
MYVSTPTPCVCVDVELFDAIRRKYLSAAFAICRQRSRDFPASVRETDGRQIVGQQVGTKPIGPPSHARKDARAGAHLSWRRLDEQAGVSVPRGRARGDRASVKGSKLCCTCPLWRGRLRLPTAGTLRVERASVGRARSAAPCSAPTPARVYFFSLLNSSAFVLVIRTKPCTYS